MQEIQTQSAKSNLPSYRWFLLAVAVLLFALFFPTNIAEAQPSDIQVTVSVLVINADASGLIDPASVCIERPHPEGWLEWRDCQDTSTSGSLNATFAIPDYLYPGQFVVTAYPNETTSSITPSVPRLETIDQTTLTLTDIKLTYPSFEGQVYEPDGFTPSPGGWVELQTATEPHLTLGKAPIDFGFYSLGGVPAGTFKLVAFPADDSTFAPSTETLVTITAGSQYNLSGTQFEDFDLRESNFTGQVQYPNGSPVEWDLDSNMQLEGYATVYAKSDVIGHHFDRITDSLGDFGLLLPVETYAVKAKPKGNLAEIYTPSIPQMVNVTSGFLPPTNLKLTYPSVRGQILDATGNPLSEGCLDIWLSPVNEPEQWLASVWHCVEDSNTFQIGGIPAGDYWLNVGSIPTQQLFRPDPTAITVVAGSQYQANGTQTVDITMAAPKVTVNVTDQQGNPKPARVELWGGDPYIALGSFSTATSPAGFAILPPGDYWIQAWPLNDDVPQWANSMAKPIDIGSAEASFSLKLRQPNVVGQVVSPEGNPLLPPTARSNTPLPEPPAKVAVHSLDWNVDLEATTNITGQFGLALPPGDYALLAHPTYHLDPEHAFTKSLPVNFNLTIANTSNALALNPVKLTYPRLVGYVLDPQGNRVSTSVFVESDDFSYQDFSHTEFWPPNGSNPFRFGGMPAGDYTVQADPPWFNPDEYGPSNREGFVVQPGSQYSPTHTEHISLTLGIPNFVGEIFFPDDQGCAECPVPHVEVKLEDMGGTVEIRTTTGYDGRFGFSNLAAGDYVLHFFLPHDLQADWDAPAPYQFNLPSALDTKDDTFEIAPALRPKTVTGNVEFSDDGAGVNDAKVVAQSEEGGQRVTAPTDPSGNYQLTLRGGEWRIWAEPLDHNANWYSDPDEDAWVAFAEDDDPETATINLAVHRFNEDDFVEISGEIVSSNNEALPQDAVFVELCDDIGLCFGGPVPPTGDFAFQVLPGVYLASVRVNPNSGFVPPQDNHQEVYAFDDVDLGTLVLRSRTASDVGRITGRVIISATGQGLSGIKIKAFSDNDFATTQTITNGNYAINLFPGFWNGGPELTEAQKDQYFVLPPAQKHGFLATGQVISNVNFFLVSRDAVIKGNVVEAGTTTPIANLNAVAYAERCGSNDHCAVVDESDVLADGSFELNVVGGQNQDYTVGVWLQDSGYIPGDGTPVTVGVGATVRGVNVPVTAAGTQISGTLVDSDTGDPVLLEATIYGFDADGNFWTEDNLWPDKDPYQYTLFIPTPTTHPVSWTVGLWVDPRSGYIADPAAPEIDKIVPVNETTVTADFKVVKLNDVISGTVTIGGNPAKHVYVFAEGVDEANQDTLFFEAKTNKDGKFRIPVLPGTYEVGAFLPPNRVDDLLPPRLQIWSSNADNPLNLAFRNRPTGAGALTIAGTLTLDDELLTARRDGEPQTMTVIGWSPGNGYVEVAGTAASGYSFPVVDNSTWYIWAFYEDLDGNAYYESQEIRVEVTDASVTNANLTLTKANFELPDSTCVDFDSTRFQRIELPARSDLPAPLLELQANTIPATGTVTICATPKIGVRDGQNVIGFAYELAAYDSQGALIEANFNKDARLIFYLTPAALPNGATLADLKFGFFSTARQEWQALTDLYVDEEDLFVTGKLDHFSTWAMRVPTPAQDDVKMFVPMVSK